eukprot:CAMPEP_0194289392 /NCGR_PEP_ID=MMETSP0169-20130528/38959_1 /TAXON_ID=218684 /ORGANISM="Corethron pennatum, Strain L29A3" /LENGTH=554 /DNA_ID=CAMNT_0039036657 /DNA_START=40 /DNA_END=1701 /DNA_ORIENTATION=+
MTTSSEPPQRSHPRRLRMFHFPTPAHFVAAYVLTAGTAVALSPPGGLRLTPPQGLSTSALCSERGPRRPMTGGTPVIPEPTGSRGDDDRGVAAEGRRLLADPSWGRRRRALAPDTGRPLPESGLGGGDDTPSARIVSFLKRYPRYPQWQPWNGYALSILSLLLPGDVGHRLSARLEDAVGGRACPNMFEKGADPFVCLVHYRHSFDQLPARGNASTVNEPSGVLPVGGQSPSAGASWAAAAASSKSLPGRPAAPLTNTPFEAVTTGNRGGRTIVPLHEGGWPSHPHRGFCALSYLTRGGAVHRDSHGRRQAFGPSSAGGGVAQWLDPGRGLWQETAFDIHGADWAGNQQEMFEIWVRKDAAAAAADADPTVQVLHGETEDLPADGERAAVPTVRGTHRGTASETVVLLGEHGGASSGVDQAAAGTDAAVLHVTLTGVRGGAGAPCWTHDVAPAHTSCLLYVRTGAVTTLPDGKKIEAHQTAFLSRDGADLSVALAPGCTSADFIFCGGAPTLAPYVQAGSVVVADAFEHGRFRAEWKSGAWGRPWDFDLDDAEW